MVDPPTGNGRDADHGLGRFGQGDDPGEEDFLEGGWQPTARGILAGPEQLFDEERVSVGASMDLGREIACRRRPEDRGQQRLGLGRVEAAQIDPLHPTATLEFGQPRQQRMASMELSAGVVITSTTRSEPEMPDEEGDGLAGRRIGPMGVLDDEQGGGDLRQPLQDSEQGVEEACLVRSVCVVVEPAAAGPSDGTSRAISIRSAPRTISNSSGSSVTASAWRSASTIGPYGTPPSPMSAQPP